ncbi:hypothetical protein HK099_007876 [Clydaea vesicula]|uniref:BTB domain-containing protein n=1 Tax=Clydaea vesicula TaxID=447962 RepID=A0AAD5TWD2_9FUNG|nr:hypothetical protein HK099_007876 [Clydaea vesicula]KAJ3396284.1 hypothetical protein HDU92_003541 [Lobulomyces angularis]
MIIFYVSLSNDLKKLLETKADITFAVGPNRILVHGVKNVLSVRSKVFDEIFKISKPNQIISLPDVEYIESFRFLIKGLVTGFIEKSFFLDQKSVLELMKLSMEFCAQNLQEISEKYFEANLKLNNIFIFLEDCINLKNANITASLVDFIQYNPEILYSRELFELSIKGLNFIFNAAKPAVENSLLLKTLIIWKSHNVDVADSDLKLILEIINFDEMKDSEIFELEKLGEVGKQLKNKIFFFRDSHQSDTVSKKRKIELPEIIFESPYDSSKIKPNLGGQVQTILSRQSFSDGINSWEIRIENFNQCFFIQMGVATENIIRKERYAGHQLNRLAWMLGSTGKLYHGKKAAVGDAKIVLETGTNTLKFTLDLSTAERMLYVEKKINGRLFSEKTELFRILDTSPLFPAISFVDNEVLEFSIKRVPV